MSRRPSVPAAFLAPWIALLILFLAGAPPAAAQEIDTAEVVANVRVDSFRIEGIEAPFVPTPPAVVDAMLELVELDSTDVVVDLGSGDGRIPIRAAERYGARGVGYELESALVAESRRAAREAGVADRVTFYQGDLFEADLTGATVVTLYLLPSMNRELRPKLLRELDPGDRVVAHLFGIEGWAPERTIWVEERPLFRWTVPEERPDF